MCVCLFVTFELVSRLFNYGKCCTLGDKIAQLFTVRSLSPREPVGEKVATFAHPALSAGPSFSAVRLSGERWRASRFEN